MDTIFDGEVRVRVLHCFCDTFPSSRITANYGALCIGSKRSCCW